MDNYDGIERIWPVLLDAGLTRIRDSEEYLDVLLMAIGLVDIQGYVLDGATGHRVWGNDVYECVGAECGHLLDKLGLRAGLGRSVSAEEVAFAARTRFVRTALDALVKEFGDLTGVFEEFLIGLGLEEGEVRFENQLWALDLFNELNDARP